MAYMHVMLLYTSYCGKCARSFARFAKNLLHAGDLICTTASYTSFICMEGHQLICQSCENFHTYNMCTNKHPENGRQRWGIVVLHISFHKQPSKRRQQCVEGAYALWFDMYCNSRIVACRVLFWRVVTRRVLVNRETKRNETEATPVIIYYVYT